MELKNLAGNENLSKRCNHPLLPQGIRGLIIGKSGYGKTTLLINLYYVQAGLTIITYTFLVKSVSTRVSYPQESF